MNIFAVNWFIKGLRGNSVTFAGLFASFVLGMSLSHYINVLLMRLGVHWLYALILPALLFMWLSKREDRLIPDESKRKLYARSLIAVSLLVAFLVVWLRK